MTKKKIAKPTDINGAAPTAADTVRAEAAEAVNEAQAIFPNGAHFGIIQLPGDLLPKPAAQRIVQWVNRDGQLRVYISENAYQRTELITWYDKLMRLSYQHSISKGGAALAPVRGRIHWCRFTEDFCKKRRGARVDPETDQPEVEEK